VPPRSASFALSSKSARSSDQDAFHRPSAPSPCRAGHFRARAWDHEEPATGVIARVLVALATMTRLPALLHCTCARTSRYARRAARPEVSRPGPDAARRLLQPTQSASTTAWIARLPPRSGPSPPCLRLRASPASLCLECGRHRLDSASSRSPTFPPCELPTEVHRPGARRLSSTSTARDHPCEQPATPLPRPVPLGHLVS